MKSILNINFKIKVIIIIIYLLLLNINFIFFVVLYFKIVYFVYIKEILLNIVGVDMFLFIKNLCLKLFRDVIYNNY